VRLSAVGRSVFLVSFILAFPTLLALARIRERCKPRSLFWAAGAYPRPRNLELRLAVIKDRRRSRCRRWFATFGEAEPNFERAQRMFLSKCTEVDISRPTGLDRQKYAV
jgi:hypothetical protein